MELEREVHQTRLLIQMAVRDVWIVWFQLLKESQLVQTLQTQFPVLLVVLLTLFQSKLAADNFVARRGVSLKFNSADVELFALVNFYVPGNCLFRFVESGRRHRRVVDESFCAVSILEVL